MKTTLMSAGPTIASRRPRRQRRRSPDDPQRQEDEHLVLIQAGRVVCTVEPARQDSLLSVARLLCRLMLNDAFVYRGPRAGIECLRDDAPVECIPPTWSEIYRATPVDAMEATVVGVH